MATEKQLRNNSEYWKKRFQMLEERNHDKADKLSEKLRKEYAKAEKEIEKLTYEWYGRIAANNEVSMDEARKLLKGAELSEFKWTVDQYIKVGSKENLSPAWLKQLENASARAHITRLDAQKVYLSNTIENLYGKEERLVKSGLMETYEDNLYRTAFEIEKGCGVGVNFAKADPRRIEAVINRPWAQDAETFSDRIWDSKAALATELETQLMQNVMLGRSNEEAVKAIEKRFGVSYRQADRLIRTETAAIASQAQQEAFKELDVEKYEIVATLDNRTSEICQEMDGKVFDMKDYEVGTTAPPFHPNCRSCTAPYLEDDYGETIHRVARDEDGKTYPISDDMTYKQWKEKFVDGDNKLRLNEIEPNDKIENTISGEIEHPVRTKEQFEDVARSIKKDIPAYSSNPSKWSGIINVADDLDGAAGTKEWSCDISVLKDVDDGVIWHEMLHSCSVSYYDEYVYAAHQFIEEASVEFLKQQICAERGIVHNPTYVDKVLVLQTLNDRFHFGTDLDFAKELFNQPLPERYGWLEDLVYRDLVKENATIKDTEEVMQFVRYLEGGADGIN